MGREGLTTIFWSLWRTNASCELIQIASFLHKFKLLLFPHNQFFSQWTTWFWSFYDILKWKIHHFVICSFWVNRIIYSCSATFASSRMLFCIKCWTKSFETSNSFFSESTIYWMQLFASYGYRLELIFPS